MPSLEFSMNGKTFTVPGKDLVIESGGMCVFAMMGMDIPDKVGLNMLALCLCLSHIHLQNHCYVIIPNRMARACPSGSWEMFL